MRGGRHLEFSTLAVVRTFAMPVGGLFKRHRLAEIEINNNTSFSTCVLSARAATNPAARSTQGFHPLRRYQHDVSVGKDGLQEGD